MMTIYLKSLTLLSVFIFYFHTTCQSSPDDTVNQNAFSHVTIYHSFNKTVAAHFDRLLKKFNAINPKFQVIVKTQGSTVDNKLTTFSNQNQLFPLQLVSHYKMLEMYQGHHDMFMPLENLTKINQYDFLPALYHYAAFPKISQKPFQTLMALPFACSTPIVFFNKTAFKEAGLNPLLLPRSWEELENAMIKLKKVGYTGLAITGGSLMMLENFSAIHHLPLIRSTKVPAFQAVLDTLQTKPYQNYLKQLARWAQEGLYVPFEDDEQIYDDFAEGNIAIIIAGADAHEMLMDKMKTAQGENELFKIGVGVYPYSKSITSKPFAVPVQGDTLWILANYGDDKVGITSFLNYLLSPEIQAEWHQRTSYLPMTWTAHKHTQHSRFYNTHPVHQVSSHQVVNRSFDLSQISVRWYLTSEEQEKIINTLNRILAGENIKSILK